MSKARSKALRGKIERHPSKRKYDRWNDDPHFSEAGSRRSIKKARFTQSPFTTKGVAKQLWKRKSNQIKNIDDED